MIALTFVCLAACAVLVYAEWQRVPLLRGGAKIIASLAFLAVGLLAAHGARPGLSAPQANLMASVIGDLDLHARSFTSWMIAGLALGVVGDAALLGKSNRAFLVGLAAFLLGHLAYVVGMAQLVSPAQWPADAGLSIVLPIGAGAIALRWLWPHLGSMRVPVIFYVLAIVAMVVGALAVLRHGAVPGGDARNYLAIGAMLFFVSDLAVARDKFVVKSVANRTWGLPAYYIAQLFIAWSLA